VSVSTENLIMADIPRQENDFRAAFDSLKTSTAAIEKHSKIIEAQREALLAFRPQSNGFGDIASFSHQHDQESGRLVFAVRNNPIKNIPVD
jgi:hypothetical protein